MTNDLELNLGTRWLPTSDLSKKSTQDSTNTRPQALAFTPCLNKKRPGRGCWNSRAARFSTATVANEFTTAIQQRLHLSAVYQIPSTIVPGSFMNFLLPTQAMGGSRLPLTADSHVDLLIIGAGPAGLMAAAWASRYGISCRIMDRNNARIETGHADGLQARTLEIFDSFGVVDRPLKEAFHLVEISSWNPDHNGQIQRTQRLRSQRAGASRFHQVAIHQGVIEAIWNEFFDGDGKIRVERNVWPRDLRVDNSIIKNGKDYPISVVVCHKSDHAGAIIHDVATNAEAVDGIGKHAPGPADEYIRSFAKENLTETIEAKYLIGCDGAHSWTRNQVGLSLNGEATEHVWGVMDIVPLSNFPDIRLSCVIHSAAHGTMVTVPRENQLVRLYIQLSEDIENGTFNRSKVTPQTILRAAKQIFAPYSLDYKICDWWSVYQIGQRIAPKFDVGQRIFLAGDAIHTHSPKAGQGMNVSMQDTYNLVWKLSLVIHNLASPTILATYHSERHAVAQDLIAMDHQLSKFYSVADPRRTDYQAFRDTYSDFIAGVGVKYGASCLVDAAIKGVRIRTRNVEAGARIPSFDLISHASAEPTHLHALLPSTGAFRLVLFASDLGVPARLGLVNSLAPRLRALLRRYNEAARLRMGHDVIELLVLHTGSRDKVNWLDLEEVFHPWDEERGWDYGQIFVLADNGNEKGGQEADVSGREAEVGCIMVIRPDQHVALIGDLDATGVGKVESFFEGILLG